MPMTKKEREEVQALRDELALAKAWRRTEPVPHDVPPPSYGQPNTTGWVMHGTTVRPAWSATHIHGTGYGTEKEHRAKAGTARQRSIPLFSTEVLALRAMRYEVEQSAAKELARIDARIEAVATQQGERSDG